MDALSPQQLTEIEAFCRKWLVVEFSLFGSLAAGTARPESDADVLVAFTPDAPWSYWEFPAMQAELRNIFGRDVDLVEKQALTNPFRRHHILSHRRVLYRAA